MKLTYEEKLQLDNSKEHLKVVLSNLRIASEELSEVFKVKELANLDLERITKEEERISKESSELSSYMVLANSSLDKREASVLERENTLVELDKKSQLEKLQAQNELDDIRRQVEILKSKHKNYIQDQEIDIGINEIKITILKEEIERCKEDIRDQSEIKKSIENEIIGLNSDMKGLYKEIDTVRKEYKKEMGDILVSINEEKEKIKRPLELLSEVNRYVDNKKRNLDVLSSRLRKQFNKQNPNGNLPAELQNKNKIK